MGSVKNVNSITKNLKKAKKYTQNKINKRQNYSQSGDPSLKFNFLGELETFYL